MDIQLLRFAVRPDHGPAGVTSLSREPEEILLQGRSRSDILRHRRAGHATSLTLHQDGDEHSAKRIDKAEAGRVAGQLAKRIKDGTPQAGSEGAVRRSIESLQAGQPNYDEMTPALAEAARQQLAYLKRSQDQLGQLQSISFRGVSPGGWDVYEVRFANGISIWRIALARDGKIAGMLFQTGP
jgi:hypothetical protein